jgi:hypothetical protein
MRKHSAVFVVAFLAGACGGNVVAQETGVTGGAGGGSSTASGTSTSTASGAGASSTGSGSSTSTGSSTTGTGSGAATYTAYGLVTNLPRYVIFKKEPGADRCVQIMVAMSGGPGLGIQTTMGWTVDQAVVTAHASDCALDANGYPIVTMMSTAATSGTGTLVQTPTGFQPCQVSVHAVLTFPTGSPWTPPTDALDVDNLPILGVPGC